MIIKIANLILGISSLILSVVALIVSFRYNKLVEAQVEMQVRERITGARVRYEDSIIKHHEYLQNSEQKNNLFNFFLKSVKEDFLNAYDEACQKYLDKKIDEDRFKKSYFNEIQSIVKDKHFKLIFDSH